PLFGTGTPAPAAPLKAGPPPEAGATDTVDSVVVVVVVAGAGAGAGAGAAACSAATSARMSATSCWLRTPFLTRRSINALLTSCWAEAEPAVNTAAPSAARQI